MRLCIDVNFTSLISSNGQYCRLFDVLRWINSHVVFFSGSQSAVQTPSLGGKTPPPPPPRWAKPALAIGQETSTPPTESRLVSVVQHLAWCVASFRSPGRTVGLLPRVTLISALIISRKWDSACGFYSWEGWRARRTHRDWVTCAVWQTLTSFHRHVEYIFRACIKFSYHFFLFFLFLHLEIMA